MSALSTSVYPAPAALPLDAHAIQRLLGENVAGWQVKIMGEVDSTNSALLREARNEPLVFKNPILLTTETQTAGRGRAGRTWQASPGASLTISFGWQMQRSLADLSGLSLVCGLAVHAALLQYRLSTKLKWPNDVLIVRDREPRKLAGILVETQSAAEQPGTLVVIGIGINLTPDAYANLNDQNQRAALLASDLQTEGASQPVDRNRLAANLALALTPRLLRFEKEGFAAFVDDWNAVHAFQNQAVYLIDQGQVICEGVALGVNALGQLQIDTATGLRLINTGDLSLRPR